MMELEKHKALVIVGPFGCGKAEKAIEIAAKYGGHFVVDFDRLASAFNGWMREEIKTIIVTRFPETRLEMATALIMITSDQMKVEAKGKFPRFVPMPHLIFLTESVPDVSPINRRFVIVNRNDAP